MEGGGEQQYISAAQFGQQLQSLRAEWAEGKDGKREGLVLFSGGKYARGAATRDRLRREGGGRGDVSSSSSCPDATEADA